MWQVIVIPVTQTRTTKRQKFSLWAVQPWGEEECIMWPFQKQINICKIWKNFMKKFVPQENWGTNGETITIHPEQKSKSFFPNTHSSQLPDDFWVSSSSGWLGFNTILSPFYQFLCMGNASSFSVFGGKGGFLKEKQEQNLWRRNSMKLAVSTANSLLERGKIWTQLLC